MNGHPRDQVKVHLHGSSSEGRAGGRAAPNVILLARLHNKSPPAIFILNTMSSVVIIMYAIVIYPKSNSSYYNLTAEVGIVR